MPPWWRNLIDWKPIDLKEREECEVREMEACLVVAKEKCVGIAKEKLLKPFGDVRIAGRVAPKETVKLVCLASLPERSTWRDFIGFDHWGSRLLGDGVTCYRASELLGSDYNYERFLT